MNRKKIHQRLLLKRKMLRNTMITLLVLTFPFYMVGWQGDLLVHFMNAGIIFQLTFMLALGYPFVPFFFFISSILAFSQAWVERNQIKKAFLFFIGSLVFISACFTFIDFLD